jgi:hypothetical protein
MYENRIPFWARAFLSVLAILLTIVVTRDLLGEQGDEHDQCRVQVWYGAQQLQPWYRQASDPIARSKRAQHLQDFTAAVCAEAPPRGIDPRLAVALAFRESSLLPRVGLGKQNGALGERGYFQVMPGGKAERFVPDDCSMHVASCNAKAAMSYLAWLRDNCPTGDNWELVGAYGRGRCPGPREARDWTEVQVARRLYCQLEPDCDTTWPE